MRCARVASGRTFTCAAVETLTDGLLDLGILKGEREQALEQGLVDNYYVHKTGHWLGLDVHDVGDYQVDGHSRELEPGMVLTIEPGIYIRADDQRVENAGGVLAFALKTMCWSRAMSRRCSPSGCPSRSTKSRP